MFGVVVRGTGVSQESIDKAAEVVELTIGDNPEMQRRLKKNKVVVVVIPHDKKLTDLPEFKRLKGKMTAENPPRKWDEIRGVGGQPTDAASRREGGRGRRGRRGGRRRSSSGLRTTGTPTSS